MVYYVWTGCQSILVPRAFSLPMWGRGREKALGTRMLPKLFFRIGRDCEPRTRGRSPSDRGRIRYLWHPLAKRICCERLRFRMYFDYIHVTPLCVHIGTEY